MDGSVIVIGVRFDGPSPLAVDRRSVGPLLGAVGGPGIEAAVLATGERTELHLAGTDTAGAIERFHRGLLALGRLPETGPPPCLDAHPYVAAGREAVLHLGRVAAGLDAGDGRLGGVGELEDALAAAEAAGTAGPVLRAAYRCACGAGRRARVEGSALIEDRRLRRLAGAMEAERLVRLAVARWADGDENEEVAA